MGLDGIDDLSFDHRRRLPRVPRLARTVGRRWLAVEIAAGLVALVLANMAVLGELFLMGGAPTALAICLALVLPTTCVLAGWAMRIPVELWRGRP